MWTVIYLDRRDLPLRAAEGLDSGCSADNTFRTFSVSAATVSNCRADSFPCVSLALLVPPVRVTMYTTARRLPESDFRAIFWTLAVVGMVTTKGHPQQRFVTGAQFSFESFRTSLAPRHIGTI